MPWLWKKPSWNIMAVGTREMEALRAPIAPCTELSLAIAVDDPRRVACTPHKPLAALTLQLPRKF
ncbi:hypothetical protein MY10362_005022 [Beauveria mimosiformis]